MTMYTFFLYIPSIVLEFRTVLIQVPRCLSLMYAQKLCEIELNQHKPTGAETVLLGRTLPSIILTIMPQARRPLESHKTTIFKLPIFPT